MVVDNDGLHGDREKKGTVYAEEGLQPIRVEAFERGGWATLQVLGGGEGYDYGVIGPNAFFH